MILAHLNVQHSGTTAISARSHACSRTCRRSSLTAVACRERSAPGGDGVGNQEPSSPRFCAAASERGIHDQSAEPIGRSRSPIGIARSLRTMSSSCSMQTSSAVGARARHSKCTLGESNESSHRLNKKCASRRRFADLLTADGRVEPSTTTKPPTLDGLCTFAQALNNALTGALSNRLGSLT
jgi:hypothetical protein